MHCSFLKNMLKLLLKSFVAFPEFVVVGVPRNFRIWFGTSGARKFQSKFRLSPRAKTVLFLPGGFAGTLTGTSGHRNFRLRRNFRVKCSGRFYARPRGGLLLPEQFFHPRARALSLLAQELPHHPISTAAFPPRIPPAFGRICISSTRGSRSSKRFSPWMPVLSSISHLGRDALFV